ncbi:MAG: D-alanyl-D-alanine carboxypeptidase/D-alanyl-D-alanine-endopeptidase [Bacteroidales bacterium]|nr:D-alanyl-D-alanine carboxypeptidase/D-alanyl-D-alanine-endopeptidase [Bacteroidales bacterium]
MLPGINKNYLMVMLTALVVSYTAYGQGSTPWGNTASGQISTPLELFTADSSFRHASLSVCFRDLATGDITEEYFSDMSVGSASVMKLLTTAVALETLGPSFRFKTTVSYTGTIDAAGTLYGDIIITGGGDPALGSDHFSSHYGDFISEWCRQIKAAGIRRINGNITGDGSLFGFSPAPGGWSWSDLGNYYGAGAHALSVYDNMFRIHLRSGETGTAPVITATEPEIPGFRVTSHLTAMGTSDRGYVYSIPYSESAYILGTIPPNRDDFVLKASLPDPPLLAAINLFNALKESGTEITGRPVTLRESERNGGSTAPEKRNLIYTTLSPTLIELITITNRESINLYAENILRGIELADGIPGTAVVADSAIQMVYRFLEENGIESSGLFMDDGSGLSRYNAITASVITDFLCHIKSRGRYGELFYSSLPAAGRDGTLRPYFRDPVFAGRMVAKSGTSTRIRNYAGYIKTFSGKEYAFAVLVNNYEGTVADVSEKTGKLLKWWIENR